MTDSATTLNPADGVLRACHCCGLIHRLPPIGPREAAWCVRCGSRIHSATRSRRSNSRAAAIAMAGLILYPIAVLMPIMTIERFGVIKETSVVEGTVELLSTGHILVGLVVLACSIIFPVGKLLAILTLASGSSLLSNRHRAFTYRVVEITGRWGMLDVLLVTMLVATLKLRDMVDVAPGPAALAFTLCVVLSLLASASFDPHLLWGNREEKA